MNKSRLKSQFWRWQKIDEMIRLNTYPNCRKISEKLELSQRTILRDMNYLKNILGAPLEYDRSRHGYYYAEKNWSLPVIKITEGDFFTLSVASKIMEGYRNTPLKEDMEKLFAKITSMLPEETKIEPNLVNKMSFLHFPVSLVNREIWEKIRKGLNNFLTIKVLYKKPGAKEATEFLINPYHLVCFDGEWYLVGYLHYNKKVRLLNMARIKEATLTKINFEPVRDFSIDEYFKNSFGIVRSEKRAYKIKVRFNPDVADIARERVYHQKEKKILQEDGSLILEFPSSALSGVQHWILSWGSSAEVLAPEELRTIIKKEINLMKNIYK